MEIANSNKYQKINTIFKRDIHNVIMPYSGLVSEELEWLRNCKFDAEEKIDGTNIRIEVVRDYDFDDGTITWNVRYRGKTDKAEVPKTLLTVLNTEFPEEKVLTVLNLQKIMQVTTSEGTATDLAKERKWCVLDEKGVPTDEFSLDRVPKIYTLYGEGYGGKIQKGGYYRKDNSFIGFDVKVNDSYLLRANRDEIFKKLGADIVPYMGQFTIDEAIEFVKKGFKSKIAQEEHLAEGLVLRTPMGLKSHNGQRIIFKVKTCDWNKYYNTYHTYDKVEQIEKPM